MEGKKISLDDLLGAGEIETSKDTEIAVKTSSEVVEKQKSQEDLEKIEEIKSEIDLRDGQAVTVFGQDMQSEITKFSDQILSQVRSKDTGEIGEIMTDLMVKVQNANMTEIKDEGIFAKLPFLKSAKTRVQKYIAKYDSLQVQIDKIGAELSNAKMELLKDIGTFDKLYAKNLDYFNDLGLYIEAGEAKIKEVRENELPALFEEAKNSDNPMALEVVKEYEASLGRFEKKIFDLKTSRTVAIQTAPQIKLIQNNDKLLVDKVTDTLNNVLPLWKSQVVIALGLYRQGKILDVQRQVSDTANKLIVQNAERLHKQSVDVAKEAERSTIDVDSLKKANSELIKTIEESLKVHEDAQVARDKAVVELEKIETDLKDAIVKTLN